MAQKSNTHYPDAEKLEDRDNPVNIVRIHEETDELLDNMSCGVVYFTCIKDWTVQNFSASIPSLPCCTVRIFTEFTRLGTHTRTCSVV
jgi:hypothetical protein